jgi:hypothetical protein
MAFDDSLPVILRWDMTHYIKSMIYEFTVKTEGVGTFPWTNKQFTVNVKSKRLDDKRASIFHTYEMKGMLLYKCARHDIQPGIAFLSTMTTDPTENDWVKLIKILVYLKDTQKEIAKMKADDTQTIKCYVDAAFAVHKDNKSQTGAMVTLGQSIVCYASIEQKVM